MKKTKENQKKKKSSLSKFFEYFTAIVIIVMVFNFIFSDSEDNRGKQEISDKEQQEREKGFHCLSGWNGSHREFVRQTKRMMKDPRSFDHIETRVSPRNSLGWT